MACAKKIFGDDHDEPLLNLISFTNFFVAEFDCKTEERDAVRDALTLISFDELTSTSEHTGRQTFFYGWVETTKNFIKKN